MARVTKAAIERGKQACRDYYRRNAAYCSKLSKAWAARNPDKVRSYRKVNLINTMVEVITEKLGVIDAYGGKCVCCGEDAYEFMTIDHKHNDGYVDRKWGRGTNLYKFLRRLGYPKDRFQLLCWNCNCAKGKYGYCPHEVEQKEYGLSGC